MTINDNECLRTLDGLRFEGNYKVQAMDIAVEMEVALRLEDIDIRREYVDRITTMYVNQTEERPSQDVLFKLTNIFLYDYMEGDTHADKVTRTEYPIMTATQLLSRRTGRNRQRNSAGVVNKEVPLEDAFSIGTDGNCHAVPARYYRE